jgi:hypothetical protein
LIYHIYLPVKVFELSPPSLLEQDSVICAVMFVCGYGTAKPSEDIFGLVKQIRLIKWENALKGLAYKHYSVIVLRLMFALLEYHSI